MSGSNGGKQMFAVIDVARGGAGGPSPQIFRLSSRFVFWEAVTQTKYCCSHKIKHFPSQIFGPATPPLAVIESNFANSFHTLQKVKLTWYLHTNHKLHATKSNRIDVGGKACSLQNKGLIFSVFAVSYLPIRSWHYRFIRFWEEQNYV